MTSPRRVLSALLPTALAAALVATTPLVPSQAVQAVEPSPAAPEPPAPDFAHDPGAEPLPTLRDLAGRPGEGPAGRATGQRRTSVTYDVAVLALDTAAGPHGTDEEESRRMIERLDEEYDRETGGRYRFRMHDYVELPAADDEPCGVFTVGGRYSEQIQAALEGASDYATWVVVTTRSRCTYAGQASLGGAGIHMNGSWSPGTAPVSPENVAGSQRLDIEVFAHEVGHNLGLEHAANLLPDHTDDPLAASPWDVVTYGDTSAVMGNNSRTMRFSAYERDMLGLLDADDLAVVGETTTLTLRPIDAEIDAAGDAAGGTRMAVVPLNERRAFALEYRPATGDDWPLLWDEEWAVEGTGTPGHPELYFGGGRGVQVRALAIPVDAHDARLPAYDVGSVLVPSIGVARENGDVEGYRTGHAPGTSVKLPGGITVAFGAQDDDGAVVTITRPDVAPVVAFDPCASAAMAGYSPTATGGSCRVADPDGSSRVSLPFALPAGPMWTSRVVVLADGVEVARAEIDPPGTYGDVLGSLSPVDYVGFSAPDGSAVFDLELPYGDTTLAVTTTDLAGRSTTATWTVDGGTPVKPGRPTNPQLWQHSKKKVVLWWASGDPSPPGVRFEVAVKRGKGTFKKIGFKTSSTKVKVKRKDRTVRFKVRAVGEGGRSRWAKSATLRLR